MSLFDAMDMGTGPAAMESRNPHPYILYIIARILRSEGGLLERRWNVFLLRRCGRVIGVV
jgi:hypothetical protein